MKRGVALLLASLLASAAPAEELWIRDVRVIDGTGAPPREGLSVIVREGRIAALGSGISGTADARIIDGAGLTLLPGLIDSHVHFVAAPGSGQRGDSDATVAELNRIHLRAYLACGVTTVLDAGAFPEVVRDLQAALAAGHPGPRYLTVGPFVRPKNGYGHPRFGEEETPADVERKLDLIVSLSGAGVKTAIEPVLGDAEPLSEELWQALEVGARKRGLPIFVHARTEEAQRAALQHGAHALMHAALDVPLLGEWLAKPDLSDEFVAALAKSGAYQLTTLLLVDTWPGLYDPARLDDLLLRLIVPPLELETARAMGAEERFAEGALGFAVPLSPRSWRPWLARTFLSRAHLESALRQGQRNLVWLHRAGVPIVVATDAPSPWPDAIYHFHGPQTAREVELLGAAGVAPLAAIAAATAVPARMLGLAGEIGTVEAGKRADLVLVEGDPSRDLRALQRVRWTLRDGVARTPEEWMRAE